MSEKIKSPLAELVIPSPHYWEGRFRPLQFITPHCTSFPCTAQELGALFADPDRKCSSNYGIGSDGQIAMYVEEGSRSFCSSSFANDSVSVTIECSSATVPPYEMTEAVWRSLIKLCVDICRRCGKRRLVWIEDKSTAFRYVPRRDEMMLTVHRWFAKKECPGDWLYTRLGLLAQTVTEQLNIETA